MWVRFMNSHSVKCFFFDTCQKLIECIPSLVHDDHRPEDVDKVDCDEDGNGGDDAYDDFRYGLMACKEKASSWDW